MIESKKIGRWWTIIERYAKRKRLRRVVLEYTLRTYTHIKQYPSHCNSSNDKTNFTWHSSLSSNQCTPLTHASNVFLGFHLQLPHWEHFPKYNFFQKNPWRLSCALSIFASESGRRTISYLIKSAHWGATDCEDLRAMTAHPTHLPHLEVWGWLWPDPACTAELKCKNDEGWSPWHFILSNWGCMWSSVALLGMIRSICSAVDLPSPWIWNGANQRNYPTVHNCYVKIVHIYLHCTQMCWWLILHSRFHDMVPLVFEVERQATCKRIIPKYLNEVLLYS